MNTALLSNAGANLGKSYLEACKLAITPSGQLVQWTLISDTLWQINLRWRCKENIEMNKHVIPAYRLARQFVTINGLSTSTILQNMALSNNSVAHDVRHCKLQSVAKLDCFFSGGCSFAGSPLHLETAHPGNRLGGG